MWILPIGLSLACLVVIGFLQIQKRRKSFESTSPSLQSFRNGYFLVFLLANSADWLQGPYVYALYEYYGHDKDSIGWLFIAGYISSMIFGTFAGSLADIYGRKRMALVFGVTYALSCLTKLSPSFWILMVGRFAGGIATSLLFTVFESWMVHEHHRRGFDQNSLNSTFGTSVLLNSLAAICAGLVASISSAFFGFVSPFMLSFLLLVALVVVVQVNWTENYGNADLEVTQNLQKAVKAIRSNFGILLLGIVQSLFEGSMYVFVFMWTPTLAQGEPEFHQHNTYIHGIIFSTFMIAVMLGSTIFGKISEKTSHTRILSILLIVAGVSLLAPVVTTNVTVLLVSFIIFEACCGLYFPIIASLRSSVIPEDSRSTIMSLFRMGLNLLVIVALKFTASLSPSISFILCCLWLFGAALMMVFCFPSIQPRESIPTHIVH